MNTGMTTIYLPDGDYVTMGPAPDDDEPMNPPGPLTVLKRKIRQSYIRYAPSFRQLTKEEREMFPPAAPLTR